VVDETTFRAGDRNVFGGGDCATGPATLIAALAAGKNAARFIDQYIREGICQPDPSDYLETLVDASKVFRNDEPFPFPGMTTRLEPFIMDPDDRVTGFEEVERGFSAVEARAEASRCLRCYRIMVSAY
jgi:formate dehydrogenase beta subunit